MMHDKLEDEGRHAPLEHARVDTHKVLRLSQNSNGVQDRENPSESNEKNCCHFVNVDNTDLNNGGKEKLTISKISLAETSESSTRNHFGNGVIRIEDENGTKYSKNKLWTNKVDGLASKKPKGNIENDENDFCPAPESNVKTFFSNLLKFSLKRLYGAEEVEGDERSDEDGTSDELTEGTMGNLQSGEGKKNKDGGKSPSKKKGGFLSKKSPAKDTVKASTTKGPAPQPPLTKKSVEESFSRVNSDSERVEEILNISAEEERKVVPPEGIVGAEDSTVTGPNGNVAPDQASPSSAKSVKVSDPEQQAAANMISDAKYISTDSWRQVQTFEINKERLSLNFPALSPQSRESSSESVFTDPLTPRALEEMKGDRTIGSGSSTISKTSTVSQRQETNFDDSTSLDDVTLIDEQLTDTEADISMSAPADKCRSASLDVSEGSFSIASAPCQRPFTLHTYKKVDLESLPSAPSVISSQDHLRRYSSVSEVPGESNVLRKVASLTLDKNTIEQKVHKPRFVPEKLDFQLYEKFEAPNDMKARRQLNRVLQVPPPSVNGFAAPNPRGVPI